MPTPRTFSNILNPGHSAPTFQYIYDPTILTTGGNQVITGGMRIFTTADISTSNVSVSGLSLTVGAVTLTGTNPVTIQNPLLAVSGNIVNQGGFVGITGTPSFQIPFTAPVYVTGSFASTSSSATAITGAPIVTITGTQPVSVVSSFSIPVLNSGGYIGVTGTVATNSNITNTAPLPISGVVQAVVTMGPVAITGFNSTIAPLAVSGNFAATVNAVAITGDQRGVVISGGWIAITGSVSGGALGNLDLTRTFLPISGINTLNVNNVGGFIGLTGAPIVTITGVLATNASVTVGNLAITGFNSTIAPLAISGNTVDTMGNMLLSGISGALTANLSSASAVTGDIRNIPGTVLAISGIVNTVVTGTVSSSISNPIGVTGTATDVNPLYTGVGKPIWSFLPIGGRATNPTGAGSVTGYNTGDFAMFNVNRTNGGLYVNQANLDSTQDTVTTVRSGAFSALTTGVSGLASPFFGTLFGTNATRLGWGITNIGTGTLLVGFNASIPTTGNVQLILKGASTGWVGDGQSFTDMPAVWKGPVSITGFGGAPCVYSAWQI